MSYNDAYNSTQYLTKAALAPRTDINDATRTTGVNNEFLLVPEDVSSIRDALVIDGTLQTQSTGNTDRLAFNEDTYLVKTTATGTDTTSFESARIGRYRSGADAVAGLYFQKNSPPVGKVEWGFGREERTVETETQGLNGFYWRYESDGSLSFIIEREGVETIIPQSAWGYAEDDPREVTDENENLSGLLFGLEPFDGSQHSRHNVDVSNGYVYRIDFAWYGGGVIVPKIVILDEYGRQNAIELFAFKPVGQTSIAQPNQPIFARLDNQGTAEADQCKVAGRQFSVVGDFEDRLRETSELVEDVALPNTGAETFVVTFRRKPGYPGIEIGIRDIITAINNRGFLSVAINADFGAQTPDWSAPSTVSDNPEETALETATVDTGGDPLTVDTQARKYNGTIITGDNQSSSVSERGPVEFPVIREQPVAFLARDLTGNGSTLHANPRFIETW